MWLVFFLIVLGLAWALLSPQSRTSTTSIRNNIYGPVMKSNCSHKQVACIDDCSFLCIEPNAKCVGGSCNVEYETDCDTDRGGIPVLTGDDVKQWSCLCTDSDIWTGPTCNTRNPNVCEKGVFLYKGRNKHQCVCAWPYEKFTSADGVEHCVDKHVYRFYRYDRYQEHRGLVGPSLNTI